MIKKFFKWLFKEGPVVCKHNTTYTESPFTRARVKELHGDYSEMSTVPIYTIKCFHCGKKWSR
jgi:hypothetical protein